MSHFLRIKTQIREREHLVHALRDLHYQFQEGHNLPVRGFVGEERAEIVVNTGSQYDIGFARKEQEYDIVADWWGVQNCTQIKQNSFINEVYRQYNINLIRDQARAQELVEVSEEVRENGEIVIIYSERG